MPAMRVLHHLLVMPTLRLRDQEIAENLEAALEHFNSITELLSLS